MLGHRREPDRHRARRHRARSRSAWAPTARARWRSAARRSCKATEKIIAKAKKIAAHLMEASDARRRAQGRQVHRRRHRQVGRLDRRDAGGLRAAQLPARRRSSRGWRRRRSTTRRTSPIPAGAYACEVEVDPETGKVEVRRLRRRRRLRQHRQPDDRRGPGARRAGAGHRPGAARARRSTTRTGSSGPAPTWTTPCRAPSDLPSFDGRPFLRHALHPQPARGEGLRRGGGDRLAAGAGQRGARRAATRRASRSRISTCR